MTVTKTVSTSVVNGTVWIRLSGTIQEVLDALGSENATAIRIKYWYDDGTTAKAVFCRQA